MPACPLPPTRPCPPHALNPVAFALPTGTCLPVRLPRKEKRVRLPARRGKRRGEKIVFIRINIVPHFIGAVKPVRAQHGRAVCFQILAPHDRFGVVVIVFRQKITAQRLARRRFAHERGITPLFRLDEKVGFKRGCNGNAVPEIHFRQYFQRVVPRGAVYHSVEPIRAQKRRLQRRRPRVGKDSVRHSLLRFAPVGK